MNWAFISVIIFLCHLSNAQDYSLKTLLSRLQLDTAKVYYDIDEAINDKDRVYRLNIRQKGLYSFSSEICDLKKVQNINAMKNKISLVSNDIKKLKNLQEINLRENYLKDLPKVVGQNG